MLGYRVNTLTAAALAIGLMGGLHDFPKAVPAPALQFTVPGRPAKRRDTQAKITQQQKKTKRRMAEAARRGNRPCK